jgi:hypothetical protein
MDDLAYIESVYDLSAEFVGWVNEVLATADLPDDLRQRVEAARDALARKLADGDAGIHRVIWSRLCWGCYEDATGALRDPDGSLHNQAADFGD